MSIAVWTANLLGWPILQITIARFALSLPLERFAGGHSFYALRSWEQSGRVYRDWLRIRRWKSLLPDGGPWFGGFAKKKLASRDQEYMRTFILETRRAEFAHWCMLVNSPIFFLWNPLWACCVMAAYGVLSNLPLILVQRYNRLVLTRICVRVEAMAQGNNTVPGSSRIKCQ